MKPEKDQKAIIDKIRKLVALSKSSNENEAANAMQKVQLLLAEYGLSMQDIKGEDTKVTESIIDGFGRMEAWRRFLFQAIQEVTFTSVLFNTYAKTITFIGREVNVIAATNLYEYLSNTIARIARNLGRRGYHRKSVQIGMVNRISERLEEMRKQNLTTDETALVLHAWANAKRDNDKFIAKYHGTPKHAGKIDLDVSTKSYAAGYAEGDKVSLDDQLDGVSEKEQIA